MINRLEVQVLHGDKFLVTLHTGFFHRAILDLIKTKSNWNIYAHGERIYRTGGSVYYGVGPCSTTVGGGV